MVTITWNSLGGARITWYSSSRNSENNSKNLETTRTNSPQKSDNSWRSLLKYPLPREIATSSDRFFSRLSTPRICWSNLDCRFHCLGKWRRWSLFTSSSTFRANTSPSLSLSAHDESSFEASRYREFSRKIGRLPENYTLNFLGFSSLFQNIFQYLKPIECCAFEKLISWEKQITTIFTKYQALTYPSNLYIILSFYAWWHRVEIISYIVWQQNARCTFENFSHSFYQKRFQGFNSNRLTVSTFNWDSDRCTGNW